MSKTVVRRSLAARAAFRRNERSGGWEADAAVAAELLGKHVILSITRGDFPRGAAGQEQFHGEVVRINLDEGVVLRLSGGEEYALPPPLAAFERAEPGEYRLRTTGEVVVNPDYKCILIITGGAG